MAKEDYGQLAKEVVAAVGGKENIVNVTNCMTRLRFVLKDDTIPNKDEVSKIKGVKGVMNQGGQYQVIIGTHVSEVVKFVKTEAGITENSKVVNKEDYQVMKKDSLWNRFFKVISGCIMPMIGPNDRRRNLERNPCDSYNSRCTCKDRRNIPCTLCSVRCDYVLYADHRRIFLRKDIRL